MEIRNRVVGAAQEIFSSMVMIDIEVRDVDVASTSISLTDSISGVIGLAGTHRGVLAIHLPDKVAIGITESFLGMDVAEIDEDVEDAVGELANMLGGNVKAILSENGRDIELSLPTTIKGKQYDFQPTKEVERTIVPFSCDFGVFEVELQLEK